MTAGRGGIAAKGSAVGWELQVRAKKKSSPQEEKRRVAAVDILHLSWSLFKFQDATWDCFTSVLCSLVSAGVGENHARGGRGARAWGGVPSGHTVFFSLSETNGTSRVSIQWGGRVVRVRLHDGLTEGSDPLRPVGQGGVERSTCPVSSGRSPRPLLLAKLLQ